LFIAVIFGVSVASLGETRNRIVAALHDISEAFFRMVSILMKFAPIGAFGAFAFTIGKYGIDSVANLAALIATFYLTSALFIAHRPRRHRLRQRLLAAGGCSVTSGRKSGSSSAPVPPRLRCPSLMKKLEGAGCAKSVVGLVVSRPGYSFNLDGTNVYMTLGRRCSSPRRQASNCRCARSFCCCWSRSSARRVRRA
jgi:aerobic C4-dicarboxylate transport protein